MVAVYLNSSWRTAKKYILMWPETIEAFGAAKNKIHQTTIERTIEEANDGTEWALKWFWGGMRHEGYGPPPKNDTNKTAEEDNTKIAEQMKEYAEQIKKAMIGNGDE